MSDDATSPETTPTGKVYTEVEFANTQAQMRAAREEAKGHRLAATNAETAKLAAEAALAAANAATTERVNAAEARFVRAELKAASIAAGINDASDALALIPMDKIERDADGNPTNAAALLDELKAAKPYLFSSSPAASRSTSNPASPPKPGQTATKRAADMTADEYAAAKAEFLRQR